jgi:hypothetical protein
MMLMDEYDDAHVDAMFMVDMQANTRSVTGVALGVGDVLVDVAEAGDDGERLGQSLGLLNALDVALVGMLACCADGDDAVWTRHLELEVGVVGDDHELGVAWSPQDCVVGPREPDHIKSEDLLPVVVGGSKADG